MKNRLLLWSLPLGAMVAALLLYWGYMAQEPHGPTYQRHSGDLPQFLLKQAASEGAHISSSSGAGRLDCQWHYASTPSGFQLLIDPADTERLVQSLLPVLGQPERRTTSPQVLFRNPSDHVYIFIATNSHVVKSVSSKPLNQVTSLRAGALSAIATNNPRLNNHSNTTRTTRSMNVPMPTSKAPPVSH